MSSRRAKCRHCNEGRVSRPRGLCWTCYYTPGVKDLYPPTSKFAPKNDEPTEEELDACTVEQQKRLPEWWPQQGQLDDDDE